MEKIIALCIFGNKKEKCPSKNRKLYLYYKIIIFSAYSIFKLMNLQNNHDFSNNTSIQQRADN